MHSLLEKENLWHLFIRAGSTPLERLIAVLHMPLTPEHTQMQMMAVLLGVVQGLIQALSLHALAYWIFTRLTSPIPEPPRLLHGLIALDPL